jgi:hypothetical protein
MEFFDAVPQGMEMLYTMAFAFGRHSAAKLVEFTFLVATPFLIMRIGRKVGMSDRASLVVAVFTFARPWRASPGRLRIPTPPWSSSRWRRSTACWSGAKAVSADASPPRDSRQASVTGSK